MGGSTGFPKPVTCPEQTTCPSCPEPATCSACPKPVVCPLPSKKVSTETQHEKPSGVISAEVFDVDESVVGRPKYYVHINANGPVHVHNNNNNNN